VDANLNRAAEGVRVVEDMLRFELDHADGADSLRGLRHALREGAKLLPGGPGALLAARDSVRDVARNAPQKSRRENPGNIISANLKRAQEAARVLEELSKPLSTAAAARFGEIRFRLYDVEKEIAARAGLPGFAPPLPRGRFLYAVADYKTLSANSFCFLNELSDAGAGMIQLRDKGKDDSTFLKRGLAAARRLDGSSAIFVMNDRVDLALAAGAGAVHLGQDDMPPAAARAVSGPALRIGFSTHSFSQAMKGLEAAPDYISLGPIFPSPTKPDRKPVGLKLLERVCAAAGDTPVVAIGGISVENLESVFEVGAAGAAAISALSKSRNLKKTLDKINGIIERFR